MSNLIIRGFKTHGLNLYVTVMTDHKTIHEKTALGTIIRSTWIEKCRKMPNQIGFSGFSLFFDMALCDATQHDKTAESTADKLVDLLFSRMKLEKHKSSMSFCSDQAIQNGILTKMNQRGVHDLENKWTLCGSHDGGTIFKRAASEKKENIKHGDTKSKF